MGLDADANFFPFSVIDPMHTGEDPGNSRRHRSGEPTTCVVMRGLAYTTEEQTVGAVHSQPSFN